MELMCGCVQGGREHATPECGRTPSALHPLDDILVLAPDLQPLRSHGLSNALILITGPLLTDIVEINSLDRAVAANRPKPHRPIMIDM
jgi:hypothetical protein